VEASQADADDHWPIERGGTLRARLLAFTLAVLVALGGAWLLLGRDPGAGERLVSEHAVPVPETARTVTVSRTMPLPSAHARRLSAMLEAGAMPLEPTAAEVLTDTDCAPDERMVSRCRNEMRLPDGRTIVLRHPHDMSSVPCLAPGEQVLLVPAAA
jgi:hypothetical protein